MSAERVKCKNFEILMVVSLNLWTGGFDLGILNIPIHASMAALLFSLFMDLGYLLNSLNPWFLVCRMEAVMVLNFMRFFCEDSMSKEGAKHGA